MLSITTVCKLIYFVHLKRTSPSFPMKFSFTPFFSVAFRRVWTHSETGRERKRTNERLTGQGSTVKRLYVNLRRHPNRTRVWGRDRVRKPLAIITLTPPVITPNRVLPHEVKTRSLITRPNLGRLHSVLSVRMNQVRPLPGSRLTTVKKLRDVGSIVRVSEDKVFYVL